MDHYKVVVNYWFNLRTFDFGITSMTTHPPIGSAPIPRKPTTTQTQEIWEDTSNPLVQRERNSGRLRTKDFNHIDSETLDRQLGTKRR